MRAWCCQRVAAAVRAACASRFAGLQNGGWDAFAWQRGMNTRNRAHARARKRSASAVRHAPCAAAHVPAAGALSRCHAVHTHVAHAVRFMGDGITKDMRVRVRRRCHGAGCCFH
ncbi:hypothetical protein EON67_12150 [archaeon]|nr:MAG: hypothetical protein EON67_12150 [archaeon]